MVRCPQEPRRSQHHVSFTDLEPAALRGVILSTHSDEEVLAWIQDQARPASVSEKQTWAEQIQRDRPDPARVEYRKRIYPHLAGRIDLSLVSVLDLIDIDEGRLRVLPEP